MSGGYDGSIPRSVIAELIKSCHCCPICSERPCDGVLACGPCDDLCSCEDDDHYDDYGDNNDEIMGDL